MLTRDGWLYTGIAVFAAILTHSFTGNPWIALPIWLLCLLLVWFFRDPSRDVPSSPLAIVSPVDGHVTRIEPVQDDLLERAAIQISIRMSRLGIFTTRSPIEGKVMKRWFPHEIGSASGLWIQTDEEDDVALVMGLRSLGSPRCYVQSGERVGQGQRCGFVPFGSEIKVLVPDNSRVDVTEGQSVQAGSDIIATLVHKE